MAKLRGKHIRSAREFNQIIDAIRAKYISAGKKPPSVTKITRVLAARIKKEGLDDKLIRF